MAYEVESSAHVLRQQTSKKKVENNEDDDHEYCRSLLMIICCPLLPFVACYLCCEHWIKGDQEESPGDEESPAHVLRQQTSKKKVENNEDDDHEYVRTLLMIICCPLLPFVACYLCCEHWIKGDREESPGDAQSPPPEEHAENTIEDESRVNIENEETSEECCNVKDSADLLLCLWMIIQPILELFQ